MNAKNIFLIFPLSFPFHLSGVGKMGPMDPYHFESKTFQVNFKPLWPHQITTQTTTHFPDKIFPFSAIR